MTLTSADIAVGKTYRGKRSRRNILGDYDDRTVLYIDRLGVNVQYDSISVANGRHYPVVSMDKFLRWARHEVLDKAAERADPKVASNHEL